MVTIKTYHVKHRRNFNDLLDKAKKVANYACQNKKNKKILTSKYVKHFGLPSAVSCQILRKYGRGTIKKVKNVNLIVPNQKVTRKLKNSTKIYRSIIYQNETVTLKPLKLSFRWNPGLDFKKINQVEISNNKFMISVTFDNKEEKKVQYDHILGIDLNCGVGRHIINAANLRTKEVLNLNKQGPNIRKMYFKKRKNQTNKKKQKIKNNKEYRRLKDLDHKMSRKIVNYALQNKLKIVVEDLKGIRNRCKKGKGSRIVNRFVNSWSFFRLQFFIEYKAKECGISFIKVKPHYTSQECSYCSIIGKRNGKSFVCTNKHCKTFKKERNSDINAAFNVGKRALVY